MAYTPTVWSNGDVITADKLNKLESGVANEQAGPAGPAGSAATVTVGSVATGEAGTEATVVNSGTESAAVLDFVIPKGAPGEGIPVGGSAGQVLAKTEEGTAWQDLPQGGVYELIETITLTEDTTSVVRTQEPDGTPYSFERLKLMVHITAATDSSKLNVFAICGETIIARLHMSGLLNTSDRYSMMEFYDDNNIWSAGATAPAGGLWPTNWYVLPTFDPKLRQVYTEINKIQFEPNTASVSIPAGTVISIYGVRA